MAQALPASTEFDLTRLAAAVCGAFVLVVATFVLIGWQLDLEVLKRMLPGQVAMKPNTALGLGGLGLALLLAALPEVTGMPGRWAVRALSGCVFVLGALTLVEYLAGWNPGIDRLLTYLERGGGAATFGDRMAPESALCLAAGAIALVLSTWPRRGVGALSRAIGVLVAVSGLGWLVAYVQGTHRGDTQVFTPMALHTALALLALGCGIALAGGRGPSLSGERGLIRLASVAPWALLLLAVVAAQTLWWVSAERTRTDAAQLIDQQFAAVRARIVAGVSNDLRLVEAAAAAVQALPSVNRTIWKRYVDGLDLESNYPGVLGLAYLQHLAQDRIPAFERARRAEGLSGYAVWPQPVVSDAVVVAYIAPENALNRHALGFDSLSEGARVQAIARARDSGQPSLTAVLTLVQERDRASVPGFVIYAPLYLPGAALDTAGRRRAALTGLVACPFRAKEWVRSLLPDNLPVAVTLADGESPSGRREFFRSGGDPEAASPSMLARGGMLPVGGRSWMLGVESLPALEARIDARTPVAVLLAGSAAALLIFGIAWMVTGQWLLAERSARDRERALQQSETGFRAMVDAVQDYAIYLLDPEGRISTWNRGAERIKGFTADEVIGRHFTMFYPREDIERGRSSALLERARNGPATDEGWRVRKDGSQFWANAVVSPLRAADGTLTGFVKVTRDHSALMEAEQALRNANIELELRVRERTHDLAEANERFELAVRGSSDGIWDWNVARNTIFYSARFHELLGYAPGELAPDFGTFESLLHPDDRADTLAAFEAHLQRREPYDIEFRLRTRDGEYRWFRARGEAIWDRTGRPLRMAGSITDVTARRLAEAGLRDSEERLRLTIDNALDAFVAIDENGFVVEWNRQAAATFGWARDDAIAQRLSELIIPEAMRERHERGLVRMREGGQARLLDRRLEMTARHRDGHEFPVELSIIGVSSGGQRIYSASLRDISERVEAEQALKQSEARLQAIIDNSPAVIHVKDLEGRYLLVSRRFEELFHVERGAVRGRIDHDIFPAAIADTFRANDRAVIARNAPVAVEEAVPVGGEARTYLSVKFPLLDLAGRAYATCAISTDITERKRAEQRLATFAERLEASNRELEEFARVASHDLQEPLRKVSSFAERLETKYATALDEQARDYIARMVGATRRMDRLIVDLLTYSRVTTRAKPFEAVDLNEVADEVLSDLEVRIEDSGAQVRVGPLPTIEAERMQMRQLMQNLIGNALKFRKPDSAPEVSVEAVVRAGDDGEVCELTVADNGVGFDPKHAERIFGVFQRLHGRGEYEGSGVGLAICRKIVSRHGGTISATAAPGKGAIFTVRLPRNQKEGTTHDE